MGWFVNKAIGPVLCCVNYIALFLCNRNMTGLYSERKGPKPFSTKPSYIHLSLVLKSLLCDLVRSIVNFCFGVGWDEFLGKTKKEKSHPFIEVQTLLDVD